MKTLKKLYNQLNTATNFHEKYPQFDLQDGKIHVLFLSPCLNESGYYRMILPALELNRSDTHSVIVGHIHKWDFNKLFDDYDTPIDFRLVQWADYVVLPAMFTDASYIVKSMRDINNDIEFAMDLDINYHGIPSTHPDFLKYSPALKDKLIDNMSQVDLITAPHSGILNYYKDLIQNLDREFLLHFESYPNLLSNFTFEEISMIKRNSGNKVRIGLILDPSQDNDLKIVEGALKVLLERHQDQVEVVVDGWTAKMAEVAGVLKGLRIAYEKAVHFLEYPERLNSLALDIGLLPLGMDGHGFSGKAFMRYLYFSVNMVPVVVSRVNPFLKMIQEGENGFLAGSEEEWVSKIDGLIADLPLRRAVGEYACKVAWERHSYSEKALARLQSIFV